MTHSETPPPPRAITFLIVDERRQEIRTVAAERERYVLGRRPTCDLVIAGDGRIAREHLVVELHTDGTVILQSNASYVGAVVNGARLRGARPYRLERELIVTMFDDLLIITRDPEASRRQVLERWEAEQRATVPLLRQCEDHLELWHRYQTSASAALLPLRDASLVAIAVRNGWTADGSCALFELRRVVLGARPARTWLDSIAVRLPGHLLHLFGVPLRGIRGPVSAPVEHFRKLQMDNRDQTLRDREVLLILQERGVAPWGVAALGDGIAMYEPSDPVSGVLPVFSWMRPWLDTLRGRSGA